MAGLPNEESPKSWGTKYNEYLLVEHNSDGTHAEITPEDIKAKSPWADVRAYGATGDGVTDDTIAIAEAVATGSNVYFPAGTYLTDGFSAAEAGQMFFGDGYETSILLSNSADNMLTIDGKNRCIVRDLYFKGGTASDSKTGNKGIFIDGSSGRTQIKSCRFDYYLEAGIYNDSDSGVHWVSDCTFLHTVIGIYMGLNSGDSYIVNNDIGWATTAAIDSLTGTLRIINNSPYNSGVGIRFDCSGISGQSLYNNKIIGNSCGDNTTGIEIKGNDYQFVRSEISNNDLWLNSTGAGVGLALDSVSYLLMTNNSFQNFEGIAVDIDDSHNILASNFRFRTCSSHQLAIDNVDDSVFTDFLVSNPGAVAGNLYVIYKENDPTRCQFVDWTIETVQTNYYKVTNTGGSDNIYRNFLYEKENGWDAGWYDASAVVSDLIDSDATSIIHTLKDDATPSVCGSDTAGEGPSNLWLTGGTTTITDFANGYAGQIITVIAEHSITITDGTNIFLSGSTNWAMTATDTLTLICKADGKWYEVSRGDNGA